MYHHPIIFNTLSGAWSDFHGLRVLLLLGRFGPSCLLKLGRLGPSCLGPTFLWAELSWADLSLGRVVRNSGPNGVYSLDQCQLDQVINTCWTNY